MTGTVQELNVERFMYMMLHKVCEHISMLTNITIHVLMLNTISNTN